MPTPKPKPRGATTPVRPASAEKTVTRAKVARPKPLAASNSGENGRDRVAELAYFHWLQRGCPEGSPQEDWLRAERELELRK